jgi:hypothetical protein
MLLAAERPSQRHRRRQTANAPTLTDADVDRTPSPNARRDMDPHPRGAAAPVVQEHPLAVPEAAEAEVASVFEEIAARQPPTESRAIAVSSLG